MEHITLIYVLIGLKVILLALAIFFGYLIQEKSTSKVDKWLFVTGIILLLLVGLLSVVPLTPIPQDLVKFFVVPTLAEFMIFIAPLLAAFVIFVVFYVKHMQLHRRLSKYETTYG